LTPDRIIAAVISGLLLALLVTVLRIAAIDYQERHQGKHRGVRRRMSHVHRGDRVELDAMVDALVLAIVKHNAVIQEAEQAVIVDPLATDMLDVIQVHREIVAEHAAEVVLLRAEIARLPRQRGPVD
jgi:hypothetical protein